MAGWEEDKSSLIVLDLWGEVRGWCRRWCWCMMVGCFGERVGEVTVAWNDRVVADSRTDGRRFTHMAML